MPLLPVTYLFPTGHNSNVMSACAAACGKVRSTDLRDGQTPDKVLEPLFKPNSPSISTEWLRKTSYISPVLAAAE